MLELWLQSVDPGSVRWAEQHAVVLDDEETKRWRRYQKRESQDLFVVAHVLTRYLLSQYADRPPGAWAFDEGTNGRPEIVDSPGGLRFNISHTDGMVAVLVHGSADCGVDVEHGSRPIDMPSVAQRVFTNDERNALFALPLNAQSDRFYQLWTLKEAFIKAKGKGLALPLKQFGFAIGNDGRVGPTGFRCGPALDTDPPRWHFFTHRTDCGFIVSVAVRGEPATTSTPRVDPSISIRQFDFS